MTEDSDGHGGADPKFRGSNTDQNSEATAGDEPLKELKRIALSSDNEKLLFFVPFRLILVL